MMTMTMTQIIHTPRILLFQSDGLAFWPLAATRLVTVVLGVGGPAPVTVFALELFLLMFRLDMNT